MLSAQAFNSVIAPSVGRNEHVHVFAQIILRSGCVYKCKLLTQTKCQMPHYCYLFLSWQLFGDVCYHCNRVIEGDGEFCFNRCQRAEIYI